MKWNHIFALTVVVGTFGCGVSDQEANSGRLESGDELPAPSTHRYVFADSTLTYHGDVLIDVVAWPEAGGTSFQLNLNLAYSTEDGVPIGDGAISYGGLSCIVSPDEARGLFAGAASTACSGSLLEYFGDEAAAVAGEHTRRVVDHLDSIARTGAEATLIFELGPDTVDNADAAPASSMTAVGPLRVFCSVSDAPIGEGPSTGALEDPTWESDACQAVATALGIQDLVSN